MFIRLSPFRRSVVLVCSLYSFHTSSFDLINKKCIVFYSNDLDEEPERGSHFCFSAEIDEALFEGNGSFGKSITDHPYFKAPKVLAETPHLLSYPPSKKKWRVSLINLERWRLDVLNEYPTLDFIFVDENEKTQVLSMYLFFLKMVQNVSKHYEMDFLKILSWLT